MADIEETREAKEEKELITQIEKSSSANVVATTLKTDERVIARVTDGIYRQPASALRELINNAYDADATRVVIKTDAPRFERISVEDDGHGMTPAALAHMLLHIGGSAKRQDVGKELGITASDNPLISPGGRKLIGKIGIGIFSVAQLTHNFQIITKVRGHKFRTVATVALKQYSDDGLKEVDDHQEYESGKVNIWREKAKDVDAHGTTIVLTDIRPQARDTLRSREVWSAIEQAENNPIGDEHQSIQPPKFHIGRVDTATGETLKRTEGKTSNVPWEQADLPDAAFKKLVNCVWDELQYSNPNPQLDKIFDYYLQMVWQLALAVPLKYVEGNIFDMDLVGWAETYKIANEPKGGATSVNVAKDIPVRNILDLKEGLASSEFNVFFDELELFRPIKFKNLPVPNHAIKMPMVFLGKCREEFSKYSIDLSGGPLEFEAYLFWTPKIAPTEHRGSLIRINGSSGTLFDPSFMRYQISEQTRLKQITCEIFIQQGFDSSLNIDRESFNYAHPHAVYLTRWLHSALRQLATTQKSVASKIRGQSRSEQRTQNLNEIQKVALEVWQQEVNDEDSTPPSVAFDTDVSQPKLIPNADLTFNRAAISPKKGGDRALNKAASDLLEEKLKAIVQVLSSFGLLDDLSKAKQERLLKAIYKILETA